MKETKCLFAGIGRHSLECPGDCYPSIVAKGLSGNGGFWKSSRMPRKYAGIFLGDIPIQKANPDAYAVTEAYIKDVLNYVKNGVGLFLYSVASPENPRGTGTGKTTAAAAIGNEYMKARIIQHCSTGPMIENQPTLFIRVAEFQNIYTKQFRGSFEEQEEATSTFNAMVSLMKKAELLIMDDISLKSATDALTNIMYEVLDERYINEMPVIFTSNYPISKISEILNEQIQSRIEGLTEQVAFYGKDNRKLGVLGNAGK